jgi:hypothetical protein
MNHPAAPAAQARNSTVIAGAENLIRQLRFSYAYLHATKKYSKFS